MFKSNDLHITTTRQSGFGVCVLRLFRSLFDLFIYLGFYVPYSRYYIRKRPQYLTHFDL